MLKHQNKKNFAIFSKILFLILCLAFTYQPRAAIAKTKSDNKKHAVLKKTAEKKRATKTKSNKNAVTSNKSSDIDNTQFYFLTDASTKEVLLEKNADLRISPSSMTKVMTAYVIFDQINRGKLTLQSQCLIGRDAWRKSGSSMFLNYGDKVSVEELLRGLLAVSGNDAAVALAESTAGGIDNFVELMNKKARDLGLKNSHFENPHGLAQEGHYMSLRDLATLTTRFYQDFPQYLDYLGMDEFTYGKVTQHNRHPLIKAGYDGVIGGKTGYTNDGGYGVIGIVKRGNRSLIGVVNKARTPQQRARIITNLMDYGYLNYKKLVLFNKDQEVTNLKTWLADKSSVPAVLHQDVSFSIPKDKSVDEIKVKVKYKGPLYSPIAAGSKIATLIVDVKGYKTFEYPLFAKETVDKAGYLGRINQILRYKGKIFLNKFLR